MKMNKKYMIEAWIELHTMRNLKNMGFSVIKCDTWEFYDGTGRYKKSQVILPGILYNYLYTRYPDVPKEVIRSVVRKIENGGQLTTEEIQIKLIDFGNPENNVFTAVSQMRIRTDNDTFCVPDIILFVNGLPFCVIELKNNYTDVRDGFEHNLTKYRRMIPRLFKFNPLCVISNGVETRLGDSSADFVNYKKWQTSPEVNQSIFNAGELTWQPLRDFIHEFCKRDRLIEHMRCAA